MIYLILAALCGASLAICFKLFHKFNIDTLQGVFFNYITALLVSLFLSGNGADSLATSVKTALAAPWAWLAVIEGFFFMGGILVLAASTSRSGVALTNVSARASMAIPVVASFLVYHEAAPSWLAIALIIIAMVLIFGTNGKKAEATTGSNAGEAPKASAAGKALLPICVFLTFGISDFLLKVLKFQAGKTGNQANIMLFIFSTAALFCLAAYLIRGHYKEHPFDWKAIPGGIILGLFNSICTALMLKALGVMDAVVFYPIYNVAVVIFSLLAGILFFKEKIRLIQFVGTLLATVGIVLLLML